MNISKLENIANSMIKRLNERAKEIGLSKGDLFFETSKNMIETLLRKYLEDTMLGENLSIKSFVVEAQRIIFSMNIAKEEHPSFC